MFGMKISSDLIKYGLIALLFITYTVWQREQAASKAREECQAEQLADTLKETKRQLEAANEALAAAEKQIAADDMAAAQRAKDLESINADAKKLGTKSCAIHKSITDRLSAIR